MIRTLLILGLVLELATPGLWASEAENIWVDGLERKYLVHIPDAYRAEGPLPLLLAFHGRTQTAAAMETYTGLNSFANRDRFIVVYPEGMHRSWNVRKQAVEETEIKGRDDIRFAEMLIEKFVSEKQADPKRVFLAGFSIGAALSSILAAKHADKIAGLMVVAGTLPDEAIDLQPLRPVPVLYMHGSNDKIMTPAGVGIFTGSKRSLSDNEYIDWWRTANQLNAAPSEETIPDTADDGTTVTIRRYFDGGQKPSLTHYRINGGGHTWPGGIKQPKLFQGKTTKNLDASDVLSRFIRARN